MKQFRAKVTTECLSFVYGLSIGDKPGDLGWTLAYFAGSKIFPQRIAPPFLSEREEILQCWGSCQMPIETSEFRELWCRGPVIPCGDMHQPFTDTLLKWFFDNFPIFADNFSVLSIHWVARRLGASFSATARPCCWDMRADRHTDRHTDTLITILRTLPAAK